MVKNNLEIPKQNPPINSLLMSGLGYFIDAAELILAALLRPSSLTLLAIATTAEEIKRVGFQLEITQAAGLLVGGIVWGIYGDKKGRKKGMLLTIALFSVAAIFNGLITKDWPYKLEFYHIFRFLSGLGLAGEFGLGSVLLLESTSKENKNIGPTIITAMGLLGIITASLLVFFEVLPWNYLFIIFGLLGFLLLFYRSKQIKESELYIQSSKNEIVSDEKVSDNASPGKHDVQKGSIFHLFSNAESFKKLIICFFIAIPSYYVVGLLVKFSNDIGKVLGTIGKVSVPISMIMFYLFMGISDIVVNFLSKKYNSRKKIFIGLNIFNLILVICFFTFPPKTPDVYHYVYMPLFGISIGYWALLVTYISEIFGTNLRATVACLVPNLIRSSLLIFIILYMKLSPADVLGPITPAFAIGVFCSVTAILASFLMIGNTNNKDLNYKELLK